MPGPGRPMPPTPQVTWAVAAALILHAVGFNMVGQPRHQPTPDAPSRTNLRILPVVHLVAPPRAASPAMPSDAQPIQQSAALMLPDPVSTSTHDEPGSTETAQTNETPRMDTPAATTDPALADGRYWPGKLLDQKPRTEEPLIIPFPEGFISVRTGRAVLQLFIDDTGAIDHIDVLEVDGPIEFADLAKRTVLATRFTPGVKDHMTVRSTIKIEVAFQRDDPVAG